MDKRIWMVMCMTGLMGIALAPTAVRAEAASSSTSAASPAQPVEKDIPESPKGIKPGDKLLFKTFAPIARRVGGLDNEVYTIPKDAKFTVDRVFVRTESGKEETYIHGHLYDGSWFPASFDFLFNGSQVNLQDIAKKYPAYRLSNGSLPGTMSAEEAQKAIQDAIAKTRAEAALAQAKHDQVVLAQAELNKVSSELTSANLAAETARQDLSAALGKVGARSAEASAAELELYKKWLDASERVKKLEADRKIAEARRDQLKLEEAALTVPKGDILIEVGRLYVVKLSDLDQYAFRRSGLSYGPLAVPYKHQLDDGSFDASTSVVAYLGRTVDWFPGKSTSIFVAAGAGGGKNTSTDATGSLLLWTLGYGIAAEFGEGSAKFKVALMMGWDWAGRGAKYKHEGHPWLSLAVGF